MERKTSQGKKSNDRRVGDRDEKIIEDGTLTESGEAGADFC
jgi:hypothetical protein